MNKTSALPFQNTSPTSQWNSFSCGFTRVQCLPLPKPGLSDGAIQFSKLELQSWRKKGLRNYPRFGQVDVFFVQDRANASELRVKNAALETPSVANGILSYGQGL